MKKPKILRRGKLTYYIYSEKVIVDVGGNQYVSYNQYDNWNRQGISMFINKLLKSKPDEYGNVVDQITLSVKCGIVGSSTGKPKDAE